MLALRLKTTTIIALSQMEYESALFISITTSKRTKPGVGNYFISDYKIMIAQVERAV